MCRLRPYRIEDARELRALANDFMVARWMTRRFPHPYTQRDADRWISLATRDTGDRRFAIELNGVLAGGAGIEALDAERTGTARLGYWLGRDYWGRGIATDAVRTLSDETLRGGVLRRLEARVFAQNVASARVLEKWIQL
jgi:[ribosomal protein S5]-alanine N-acetyltransferase